MDAAAMTEEEEAQLAEEKIAQPRVVGGLGRAKGPTITATAEPEFDPSKPSEPWQPEPEFDPSKPSEDWTPKHLSWTDVAREGWKNIPHSAVEFGKAAVQPIIHPVETAQNIGAIGGGVLQKLGLMQGEEYKPYADAVGKFLVERYGSEEGIKQALATDPVGMAADVSMLLTGGAGLAARIPGVAGRVTQAVGAVGRAVDPLRAITAPLAAPIAAAAPYVGKAAATAAGYLPNVGRRPIETAAEAGYLGGAPAREFRGQLSSTVPMNAAVEEAQRGISELTQRRGAEYQQAIRAMAADTTPLKFDDIDNALARTATQQTYAPPGHVAISLSETTNEIRAELAKRVQAWKALGPDWWTPVGLDALKKKIVNEVQPTGPVGSALARQQERVKGDVVNAIRKTITDQHPPYAKMMRAYETAERELNEIARELSLSRSVFQQGKVGTSLRKLQSVLRDNVSSAYGQRKELAQYLIENGSPNLMYQLAGQALKSGAPRGLGRLAQQVGMEGLALLSLHGATTPSLRNLLIAGGSLAAASPRLAGEAAYWGGVGARKLGQLPRPGLARPSAATGRVSYTAEGLPFVQAEPQSQQQPVVAQSRGTGGGVYAQGGRVHGEGRAAEASGGKGNRSAAAAGTDAGGASGSRTLSSGKVPEAKIQKGDVDYSKGMPSAHCGICRFYHSGICEKVAGRIDPTYWCKLFKKQTPPTRRQVGGLVPRFATGGPALGSHRLEPTPQEQIEQRFPGPYDFLPGQGGLGEVPRTITPGTRTWPYGDVISRAYQEGGQVDQPIVLAMDFTRRGQPESNLAEVERAAGFGLGARGGTSSVPSASGAVTRSHNMPPEMEPLPIERGLGPMPPPMTPPLGRLAPEVPRNLAMPAEQVRGLTPVPPPPVALPMWMHGEENIEMPLGMEPPPVERSSPPPVSPSSVSPMWAHDVEDTQAEPPHIPLGSNPAEVDLSSTSILHPDTPALPSRSRDVWDIGKELHRRGQDALEALGLPRVIKEGDRTPEIDETLARVLAHETQEALAREGHAADWYTNSVRDAVKTAAALYPEIATDPHAKFGLLAAKAITSQGETVPSNVRLADQVYQYFKEHGRFPTNVKADKQAFMNGNFVKLNDLLDELGPEGTRNFLNSQFTVRELEARLGYKIAGAAKDDMVYGSAILGPKIGQGFYQNLNGNFDPVTTDLWFMRTWGRLTGTLSGKPDAVPGSRARLERELATAGQPVPKNITGLSNLADRIVQAHERDYRTNRALYDSGEKEKSQLTYAAERLQHNLHGIKETPNSAAERRWMKTTIGRVRELLAREGHRVTNADIQALLWYPEKDIYSKLGSRPSEEVNMNYLQAWRELARQRGYTDEQLDQAIRTHPAAD